MFTLILAKPSTVSCNTTIAKSVRHRLSKWIKGMETQLDSQTHWVLIINTKSSWQPVTMGIPQEPKVDLYPLFNIV